jgi:hypothetical protein
MGNSLFLQEQGAARSVVIARSEATKQSRLGLQILDCFAALAMTVAAPERR